MRTRADLIRECENASTAARREIAVAERHALALEGIEDALTRLAGAAPAPAEVSRLRVALETAASALAFAVPIAAQITKPTELYCWSILADAEPARLTRTHIHEAAAAFAFVRAALDERSDR